MDPSCVHSASTRTLSYNLWECCGSERSNFGAQNGLTCCTFCFFAGGGSSVSKMCWPSLDGGGTANLVPSASNSLARPPALYRFNMERQVAKRCADKSTPVTVPVPLSPSRFAIMQSFAPGAQQVSRTWSSLWISKAPTAIAELKSIPKTAACLYLLRCFISSA